MLTKINEGGVKSDTGFSVQIKGPEWLQYKHGDSIIDIDLAYDSKSKKIYIYVSKINCWHLLSGKIEIIPENEKNIIANNIKQAIKLLKGNFEVV